MILLDLLLDDGDLTYEAASPQTAFVVLLLSELLGLCDETVPHISLLRDFYIGGVHLLIVIICLHRVTQYIRLLRLFKLILLVVFNT